MDLKGRKVRKKSLAVSVACMAIYWPTPGFKLCVLTRWDFNFCVRSSPLREFMEWNTVERAIKTVKLVSELVLWAQSTTKDYIRAEHKLHSITKLFISQVIIPQVKFLLLFFLAHLHSAGTPHGALPPAGWPILFCGPTQEPCASHSQHRKNRERFWKNAGEWTGSVEISKEEKFLAVSVACMAI